MGKVNFIYISESRRLLKVRYINIFEKTPGAVGRGQMLLEPTVLRALILSSEPFG